MKILCVGGGPAGLYFAILMKQRDPSHDITVFERNRPDDTFGFGVVFPESALNSLQHEDEGVYQEITANCQAWDPIEVRLKDQTLFCGGNGFSAISRKRLLMILQTRAAELGVNVRFSSGFADLSLLKHYDLVVAADGVNSQLRFRRVRNQTWHYQHIVLMGDAAHTAHFSVGSGTKMAMEDAIALCQALGHCRDLSAAFEEYERVRKPEVERIQRASLPSQAWWEDFRRYLHFAPEQFVFNFLTRNPRITCEKLQQRDPQFVMRINSWFTHEMMSSFPYAQLEKASPLSMSLQLKHMTLANRIAFSLRGGQGRINHASIGKAGLVCHS